MLLGLGRLFRFVVVSQAIQIPHEVSACRISAANDCAVLLPKTNLFFLLKSPVDIFAAERKEGHGDYGSTLSGSSPILFGNAGQSRQLLLQFL